MAARKRSGKNFIINQIDKALSLTTPFRLKRAFRKYKKQHIQEFINDQISQEIQAGATGSSKFLSEGDLFSFFGFKAGSTPIKDLENFLNHHIRIVIPKRVKNLKFDPKIIYPDESDFAKAAKFQLPWGAGSWPLRVEHGLPNLSKYVSLTQKGRSRGGLQLKKDRKKFKGADWGPHPYISVYQQKFIQGLDDVLKSVK